MMHLLAHELAGLATGRFALALGFFSAFDCLFFRHVSLLWEVKSRH
jgi:hypothetical protein